MECEKQKECLLSEVRSHLANITTFEIDIKKRQIELLRMGMILRDYKLKLQMTLEKLSTVDSSVNWREEIGVSSKCGEEK